MYFNYHAKIKKLILDGKLVSYEFRKEWNGISPALVFFFSDEKPMPVREYRFEEYMIFLKDFNSKKEKNTKL